MSTQKRERELARAKFERQQQRRAERTVKARRNQRIAAIVVVAGIVIAGVGWVLFNATRSSDADLSATDPNVTDSSEVLASTKEPDQGASESADPASGESGVLNCTPAGTPRADDLQYPDGPTPTESTPTSLSLNTNCGDIVIELNPAAPETVASEAFLAAQGFYDNTTCHRLTTEGIFVLQCGDPAGNGTGGPGYVVPDENLPPEGESNYPAGTVAMANAGPGTSGSQFFIVYQDTTLPSGYTIWGQIVSGLDIVQEIASVGVEGGLTDGPPAQPVFINSATVS